LIAFIYTPFFRHDSITLCALTPTCSFLSPYAAAFFFFSFAFLLMSFCLSLIIHDIFDIFR